MLAACSCLLSPASFDCFLAAYYDSYVFLTPTSPLFQLKLARDEPHDIQLSVIQQLYRPDFSTKSLCAWTSSVVMLFICFGTCMTVSSACDVRWTFT